MTTCVQILFIVFICLFTVCICLFVRMCLVRLKVEDKDGQYMYRKLVEIMWQDVQERMKVLGVWNYHYVHKNNFLKLKLKH